MSAHFSNFVLFVVFYENTILDFCKNSIRSFCLIRCIVCHLFKWIVDSPKIKKKNEFGSRHGRGECRDQICPNRDRPIQKEKSRRSAEEQKIRIEKSSKTHLKKMGSPDWILKWVETIQIRPFWKGFSRKGKIIF